MISFMYHLILAIGMWIEWWTGVTNIWWYNWWSAFGSDLSEWVALFSALGLLYKSLHCHQDKCRYKYLPFHRLAFRHIDDPDTHEHFRLCHKHHPRKKVTAEHIADLSERINKIKRS